MYESLEEIYRKIQKQNQEKIQEELRKQEFSKSWIGRKRAQAADAKAKKIFLQQSEML